MPQPTQYIRSYDFTDFQEQFPNQSLPASPLDANLDLLGTSINQVISRLTSIQKDDGGLANQSVTIESLSNTVTALLGSSIDPKGQWVTATAYARLDLVSVVGVTYLCVTAHTSGTFSTDLAAGKWILFSNPASAEGEAFFQKFSGTGAQVAFTTSTDLGTDEKGLLVFIDDAPVDPNDFTINGTTLTFDAAPALGTNNIFVFAPSLLLAAAGSAAADAEAAQAAAELAQAATEDARDEILNDAGYIAVAADLTGANTIGAVAAIAANVSTVAGISADVTAVAAVASEIAQIADEIVAALRWTYSDTTAMADPGTGLIRLNNATEASVTAIAIDDQTAQTGNPNMSAYVLTWDDSTSTAKGVLKLVKSDDPAVFALYSVTGLTDNSGWTELAVTYITGAGSFTNADDVFVSFIRTGDKGDTGSVADGDKGDITVSASGATWTIDNDAVTLAKMAAGTAGNLITYDASGDPAYVATGTSGQVLKSNGAGAAPTFQDSAAANPLTAGYVNSRYYSGHFGYGFNSTGVHSVTADRLYCRPFIVTDTTTFTRIGIEVTTLSAGNARLGIYRWVNGVPDTLVLDAGTVSTGTTGLKEVTISQQLTPGVYGLAVVFSATPQVRSLSSQTQVQMFFGDSDPTGSGDQPVELYKSHAYAALPSPFGGSITYVTLGTSPQGTWLRVV